MNIKAFAHQTHGHLEAATGLSIKRSHIYELIAAGFGDKSYASLQARGILCPLPSVPLRARYSEVNLPSITKRAVAFGYQVNQGGTLTQELCRELEAVQLGVVPYESILAALLEGLVELYEEPTKDEAYEEEWDAVVDAATENSHYEKYRSALDLNSDWVVDGLKRAAERDDGRAHFALGLLAGHSLDTFDEDDWNRVPDDLAGRYWFERGQHEVLSGIEKAWADEFGSLLKARHDADFAAKRLDELAVDHLRKAAESGIHDALLILGERYGDDSFFNLKDPDVTVDPRRIPGGSQKLQSAVGVTSAWSFGKHVLPSREMSRQ